MSGGVPVGWVLVPVEQEDRELAATAQRALYPQHGEGAGQGTLDGLYDTSSLVQAFARRRLATPTPPIEGRDADVERAREALTPSGATKAAYHGEFTFDLCVGVSDAGIEQNAKVYVPWDIVKEIMAAIRTRAALRALGERP